ncbi:MAG: hypothetical protein ACJ71N_07800 [Terriglobales bacterium]|jgi:hypothetical protein
MKLRIALFVVLVSSFTLAADKSCDNGRGGYKMALADGFILQVAPNTDGKCFAALTNQAGEPQYTTAGDESHIEFSATGRDLNADGKNDAVVETLQNGKHHYAVLTPGATPALVREIITNEQLAFEDRLGDGKIEIFGREQVFVGIDGLPQDVSPAPMAIFRMSGNRIYPVMNLFWPEYEADINQAKAYISKDALAFLQGVSPKGADEHKPAEDAAVADTKGRILTVVLSYIYGGKPQLGWQYLMDNWQDRDKDRIRSLIISARNHGLLGEINANPPQPAPAAAQAAQPAPAATPVENK